MVCSSLEDCYSRINSYCRKESTGYPLIVNVENYNDFQKILSRMKPDTGKKIVCVSEYIGKNGFPIVANAIEAVKGEGTYVLAGVSQELMTYGTPDHQDNLEAYMGELIDLNIKGHAVILLSHCRPYLNKHINGKGANPRHGRSVVLVEGNSSPHPRIVLAKNRIRCNSNKPKSSFAELQKTLEQISDEDISKSPVVEVIADVSISIFARSAYVVEKGMTAFEALCGRWHDFGPTVTEQSGTEKQWDWLLGKAGQKSFEGYLNDVFGGYTNLVNSLNSTICSRDRDRLWVLWLGLKSFDVSNKYLNTIVMSEKSVDDFVDDIYFGLIDFKPIDIDFDQFYKDRAEIIRTLPQELGRVNAYCDKIGIHCEDAVYYLTPDTEPERHKLLECLEKYDYTENQIKGILESTFKDLARYMDTFEFDGDNTPLPPEESGYRSKLTEYFRRYKLQKLTNKIQPDFVDIVDAEAQSRKFMLMQPRSSFVSDIVMNSSGEKTGYYFFDALGVEYLSYIKYKCTAYGLTADISIGHCELPSITVMNKEFYDICPDIKKISELDDFKHHSKKFNYEICKEPIHLFSELEIIDANLKAMQAELSNHVRDKIVIMSDHGASRLAVLYGKDSDSDIKLDEKGGYSGRCCLIDHDPGLPQASYENGYAVLANYERFKGGRKANVEVHGGAALEEVLVPVITLRLKPVGVEYSFTDPVVVYSSGSPTCITLFSNKPMNSPKIKVNGRMYEGKQAEDANHFVIELPDISKTGNYEAAVYEDHTYMDVILKFKVERKTKQKTGLFD